LRGIAEETSLGLQTVRTILDQQDGVDRTTIKQCSGSTPTARANGSGKPSSRCGNRCRGEIAAMEKADAELRKEAKGLK
jgi:hypothetical protein